MITFREEESAAYGIRMTYICTFCGIELAFFKESPTYCHVCDKSLPNMHMLIKDVPYKQHYHFNMEEG